MNCTQCQRQLLEENLGPEVEAHLAECMACRQWHKLLLQVESQVPLLPVPASPRKVQLQEQLMHRMTPLPETMPLYVPTPPSRPFIHIPWRKLAVAGGGLAAAGVLIACGIFLGNMLSPPGNQKQLVVQLKNKEKDKTLAANLLELDMQLAQADNTRERVETLAKLAQNLEGESRSLAQVARPKDLHTLAKLYSKVVEEGLVQRARKLPAAERRQVLDPILGQLMVAKKEAEEMAQKAPAERAVPFQVIAAAARNGDLQLRKLMEETP
jgi:hypothetical protein